MIATAAIWLAIGFLGQALFSARFLVQWIASERTGRSTIPLAFWFLSKGGTLLDYATYKQDPVLMVGQAASLFVYARNLLLIFRERREVSLAGRGG